LADETPNPDPQPDPVPDPQPQAVEPAPPQYATRDDFARLERTLANLAAAMPQPAAPATKPGDLSDDELWTMAQQGNRAAFEMYQERIADRKIQQRLQGQNKANLVGGQLQQLVAKYPELTQAGHVMNTRYQQFFTVLRNMGEPDGPQTYLDAALRAVADSRDVIGAKPIAPARTPMSGHMGAAHREPERQPAAPNVSGEEAALARKMGVKDPSKATTKFWERNKNGLNSVSPNVAAALQMGGQG
jgi:hypothetical protein